MNQRQINKAVKLLGDRIERYEVMVYEKSYCLSIQWKGGGSHVFYSLDAVEDNVIRYDS